MPDQWPRALLRAALRDAGYDALGAPTLRAGLRYRPESLERGPVRLVLVDQAALVEKDSAALLERLRARHANPGLVLLARATSRGTLTPGVTWRRVLRRPVAIAELVAAVQDLVPLASALPQE